MSGFIRFFVGFIRVYVGWQGFFEGFQGAANVVLVFVSYHISYGVVSGLAGVCRVLSGCIHRVAYGLARFRRILQQSFVWFRTSLEGFGLFRY